MDKCQKNAQESSKGTDQGGIDRGGEGGGPQFQWVKEATNTF